MSTSLWWLVLAIAILLTITPTLTVVRRSGTGHVPFFVGGARPPWWATTPSFVGIPLLFHGARGVGGGANPWPYLLGAVGISLLGQLGLILRHNRHAESP
jgi:hypothetical protein